MAAVDWLEPELDHKLHLLVLWIMIMNVCLRIVLSIVYLLSTALD